MSEINDDSIYVRLIDGSWKEISKDDVVKYLSYGCIVLGGKHVKKSEYK